MISKNKIKFLRSLELKKNRDSLGLFLAEGPKVVGDIVSSHPSRLRIVAATDEWLDANKPVLPACCEVVRVTNDELTKISLLCHPQQVLAVFEKFNNETIVPMAADNQLTLALDGVQNPGNLGTIIRVADWFGIERIVCSHDTADVYNPKVVQATMGSIARVNVAYTDLCTFLASLPPSMPVYGTLLEGGNMYNTKLLPHGVVIMGNEGKGISPAVRQYVTHPIRIPNYPEERETAESLNVAIATAIVCSEFRRIK